LALAASTKDSGVKLSSPPQAAKTAATASSGIDLRARWSIAAGWHTRTMDVVAHAGHWLVNILYALPVIVVAVSIVVSVMRQRREEREGDQEVQPPASA
jgi:hypothetical protein